MNRAYLTLAVVGLIFILAACTESAPEIRSDIPPTTETQAQSIDSTADLEAPTEVPVTTASSNSPNLVDEPASDLATAEGQDPFALERALLVETGVVDYGIQDEAVVEAMAIVPRHEFVPEEFIGLAYANHPLPIGYGQTISQPYIVALMTEAVDVSGEDKVLEVGTGSGYQAAVLSRLVDHVHTIEIIEPLALRAEEAHDRVGYENVTVRTGDGYFGWPEEAPFDAIVVTAAPDHVPQPLVGQLKIGGRLVIPVGPVGGVQTLWLITKIGEDEVETRNLGAVRFVPLTREEG